MRPRIARLLVRGRIYISPRYELPFTRLILEINMRELLAAVIAHDKAGVQFFDGGLAFRVGFAHSKAVGKLCRSRRSSAVL